MSLLEREGTTICAPITPAGKAGVSLIRVSGPQSLMAVRRLARFLPDSLETHKVYYGRLADSEGEIDEALVTYFAEGKSFTGEETLEIATHGNPEIVELVLSFLRKQGVLIAIPGEFTFRAFFNNRIDLVQAESVLTLIEAGHEKSVRLSLRQLKGALSSKLLEIENNLTWILANIEAGIDFSTEDIDVLELMEIKRRSDLIQEQISQLVRNYSKLRPVVDGLRVLFLGQPNVGKSSLLNHLIGSKRAIVTDIPGTTRDLIEGQIRLENGNVTIIDSAGLRETTDEIEIIGIKSAVEETKNVDIVVYLVDSAVGISEIDTQFLKQIHCEKWIVGTKADLLSQDADVSGLDFVLSNISGEGFDTLKNRFEDKLKEGSDLINEPVLRARQNELLIKSADRLRCGLELLHQNASLEFVALELREALLAVYELMGKKFDDQVMDRVFSEFCIGK